MLHIDREEAELIRHIFRRYLDLGSGRLVVAELDRDGHRSKQRINRHGRIYGRQPISRGALYAILQNRLYIGEVVHKENVYPGQHAAIIDIETFEAVQQRELAIAIVRNGLQAKIVIPPPASREPLPNPSLLKLVAQAFAARAQIDKGGSFLEVASRLGCGREYLADLLRTSYLAPSIIQAILEGRQPADLSRKRLVQTNRIPLGWGEQEALFGFS